MWKTWARIFVIGIICCGLFGCMNNVQDEQKVLADFEEENKIETAPSINEQANYEDDVEANFEEESIQEEVAQTAYVESSQTIDKETETTITWDDFFDDGRQSEPSEKFWQLRGQTVELKGWMGEVLNLGQGWFLLIPAPGADCPFCSEDESYWNEIMIVFVEDKKQLRHTKEPLLVRGRLDVGIKVDESNYKTMFRLYDATFETL